MHTADWDDGKAAVRSLSDTMKLMFRDPLFDLTGGTA
jgi:hypothetical protein